MAKDEWEDGGLYFTQHPLNENIFVLAKASRKNGDKCLYFFSCDSVLRIDWKNVQMAILISLKTRHE
jgi:hypothetical protein